MKASYYTNTDKTEIWFDFTPETPKEMMLLQYYEKCIKSICKELFWEENPVKMKVKFKIDKDD